jgi:hypothetical protein
MREVQAEADTDDSAKAAIRGANRDASRDHRGVLQVGIPVGLAPRGCVPVLRVGIPGRLHDLGITSQDYGVACDPVPVLGREAADETLDRVGHGLELRDGPRQRCRALLGCVQDVLHSQGRGICFVIRLALRCRNGGASAGAIRQTGCRHIDDAGNDKAPDDETGGQTMKHQSPGLRVSDPLMAGRELR